MLASSREGPGAEGRPKGFDVKLLGMGEMMRALLILALAGGWASAQDPYLEAGLQAGNWLRENVIETEHGTVWALEPAKPVRIATNLYSGTSGVVLYWLEHHQLTGQQDSLELAAKAADYLVATLPSRPEDVRAGLYTGLSGVGFALHQAYLFSGDEKYLFGAREAVRLIGEAARPAGGGVEWGPVTDIIGGTAGIGLFLLYAEREMGLAQAGDLAAKAGRRLIGQARPERGGLKWPMAEEYARLMPNFSHGTAGIAYFLAALHQRTGERDFLEAAVSGARYLQAIAEEFGDGDACLIFHHEPEGEDLYYLSWCHGPAGTARLFYRLYQVTDEEEWMDWVRRLAKGIERSGIPEKQTPGYWNNVSQCCGAAGVAEFFMNLHRATGEEGYLAFARRVADALLDKATVEDGRAKWIQAEHRVRPELLQAQTGYMQGAAGIGLMLFHLHRLQKGGGRGIVLPDSPF